MKREMLNPSKNQSGVTFIELLLYIAIFLILTPVLLTVSINSVRFDELHESEKQSNTDSQFVIERVYDLISSAKRVDTAASVFAEADGVLQLIMQDDSVVVIERNPASKAIEITEGGFTTELSSEGLLVEELYFERIEDDLNDPEIVLGVNMHMKVTGTQDYAVLQEYITSANLERGDFDDDGAPDHKDIWPRHPECTTNADSDGVCDEMDNCVLEFNPFQEDFDLDGIGDACDPDLGISNAFNCVSDDGEAGLIALINRQPPIPNGTLKNILMSSNPLSPAVLQAIVDRDPEMDHGSLQQIFSINTKLPDTAPDNVYQNILNMGLPPGHVNQIIAAQAAATGYAWQGGSVVTEVIYQVDVDQETGTIRFFDPDFPLGGDQKNVADIFIVTVTGASPTTTVTTEGGVIESNDLNGAGTSFVTGDNFEVALESVLGNRYIFSVNSLDNADSDLTGITFDFGLSADISDPVTATHTLTRFTYYCPGGCSMNCGDVGTGIATGEIITDTCYKADETYPEWCSRWLTWADNNAPNAAYIGGTQEGEQLLFWEKEFKTILLQGQIDEIDSITIAGEVAYQSTTQFFCDTLSSSCPMNGSFVNPMTGTQDVELFNWSTQLWEVVGDPNLDDTTSDQQAFEIMMNSGDLTRFVGGSENQTIRARMRFHWDGVAPAGQTSAPAFMLIDYFTLHLKW